MASFFTKKIVKQFFSDVAKGSQRFRELSDAEAQRDQELEARDQRERTRQDRADERARLQREQNQAQVEARIDRESDKATKAGDKAVLEGGFKAEGIRRKQKVQKDVAAAKLKATETKRRGDIADREDKQKHDLEKAEATRKSKAELESKKRGGITLREIFKDFNRLDFSARREFKGDDGFKRFTKKFLQETGLKLTDGPESDSDNRPSSDPSAGDEASKQAAIKEELANQRPDLISTGIPGIDSLNQIATGRSLPQVQQETGTATDFDNTGFQDPNRLQDFQDQIPAEFPPDFPVIPGTDTGDGSIDLTSAVDPSFHIDPQRSEAAVFADALYSKDEFGLLTEIEEAWLVAYEEAVGLAEPNI